MNRPVIVTTAHRGVFFGYLVGEPAKKKVLLTNARNCVYWSEQLRGFIGLADSGPGSGCKVGPKAPEITLFDVTSVVVCTEAAAAAWEKAPWQ